MEVNINRLAEAKARKLLKKYNPDRKNIYTIYQIMNAEGLLYREAELIGCEGNIVFNKERGIITISTRIECEEQKRFVAAHEMGHFFNERETLLTPPPTPLLNKERGAEEEMGGKGCGFEEFYGSMKNYKREADANSFAAEFLMPTDWFINIEKEFNSNKKNKSIPIKELAEYFDVTLTAAAIRYGDKGTIPTAIILSKDGSVKWSVINKQFPYQFIRNGKRISDLSYVSDFFKGDEIPAEEEDVPAKGWFDEDYTLKDREARVLEFNIPMRKYNAVLTVLREWGNRR